LENEQLKPDLRTISIRGVFDSLSERFAREAEQKHVRLSFDAPESLNMVADEPMIIRAVENFLTNALRHTPESGEICVNAEAEAEAGRTRICVFNSGSHLTQEQLERIWDVFYTGENSDRANGHGVGLAIVKSIAQLHGGSVSAENQADGVAFCIVIPRKT